MEHRQFQHLPVRNPVVHQYPHLKPKVEPADADESGIRGGGRGGGNANILHSVSGAPAHHDRTRNILALADDSPPESLKMPVSELSYDEQMQLRKTRGRVKIKMEFIENKLRRYTTFSKRKTGIMKKAYELSTLTGTQVMLLVASETGHVYTFATPKLQPMITCETGKSLIQTCLNSPDMVTPGQGSSRMSSTGYEETDLTYHVEDEQKMQDNHFAQALMQSSYPTPPGSNITRSQHQPSSDSLATVSSMSSMSHTSHAYPLHGLHTPTPTTPYPHTSSATSPIFSYHNPPSLLDDTKDPHLTLDDGVLPRFPQPSHYLSQPSPALSTSATSPGAFYPGTTGMPAFPTGPMQPAQQAAGSAFPSLPSTGHPSPSSPNTPQDQTTHQSTIPTSRQQQQQTQPPPAQQQQQPQQQPQLDLFATSQPNSTLTSIAVPTSAVHQQMLDANLQPRGELFDPSFNQLASSPIVPPMQQVTPHLPTLAQ